MITVVSAWRSVLDATKLLANQQTRAQMNGMNKWNESYPLLENLLMFVLISSHLVLSDHKSHRTIQCRRYAWVKALITVAPV